MTPAPRPLASPVLALLLLACGRFQGGSTDQPPVAQVPPENTLRAIPLGAPPGEAVTLAAVIRNPFEGDPIAVQAGNRLFGQMNCVYCHGPQGSGLIGPPLNAPAWRYGGAPAEIYNSIHDGRPKGMPAWGARLPPAQIWQLVAYIESLGGTQPPSEGSMVAARGVQPSPTGPEPAQQSQADTAQRQLQSAQRESR